MQSPAAYRTPRGFMVIGLLAATATELVSISCRRCIDSMDNVYVAEDEFRYRIELHVGTLAAMRCPSTSWA
jgi:hypothetical protein